MRNNPRAQAQSLIRNDRRSWALTRAWRPTPSDPRPEFDRRAGQRLAVLGLPKEPGRCASDPFSHRAGSTGAVEIPSVSAGRSLARPITYVCCDNIYIVPSRGRDGPTATPDGDGLTTIIAIPAYLIYQRTFFASVVGPSSPLFPCETTA